MESARLDVAWKDIGGGYTAPRSRATNIAYAIAHVTADTVELYLVHFSPLFRAPRDFYSRVCAANFTFYRAKTRYLEYTYIHVALTDVLVIWMLRVSWFGNTSAGNAVFLYMYAFFARSFKYPTYRPSEFQTNGCYRRSISFITWKIFFLYIR